MVDPALSAGAGHGGEALSEIPLTLKARCVELLRSGMTMREIYTGHFVCEHEGMSYETFRRKLRSWKNRQFAESDTLNAGTYEGFAAHSATVQVAADGSITQAWIKQSAAETDWDGIIAAIREASSEYTTAPESISGGEGMLEIPLFDMHFGVSSYTDYCATAARISALLRSRRWEQVNFIIGQDLIHNNDMRGHTAKGTPIEAVDIPSAWSDAQRFYFPLIELAMGHCADVRLWYSKGNHDECVSWCFMEMLRQRYPTLEIDDSFKARKCILWRECFVGFVHGDGTKARGQDLRGQFTIGFPLEFAGAKVREIHAGHLHNEQDGDLYGVMVRRLASAVPCDGWSDDEGYVGAHKRFQVFEYAPARLAAVHYV